MYYLTISTLNNTKSAHHKSTLNPDFHIPGYPINSLYCTCSPSLERAIPSAAPVGPLHQVQDVVWRRRRSESISSRGWRDGELAPDGVDLLAGADDEDDGDEGGEQLLREPGVVLRRLSDMLGGEVCE